MLVVLTIMGVMASAVSFVATNRPQSLKQDADDVVRQMRLAQQQAVREQAAQRVEINLADNTVYFGDEIVYLRDDTLVTVKSAEDQLIDAETVGLTFFPDSSSSGGTILLEAGPELVEISVIWMSGKIISRHLPTSG